MATKSVLKNIDIQTSKSATAFVSALEYAKGKCVRPIAQKQRFTDATREEIRKMFNKQL